MPATPSTLTERLHVLVKEKTGRPDIEYGMKEGEITDDEDKITDKEDITIRRLALAWKSSGQRVSFTCTGDMEFDLEQRAPFKAGSHWYARAFFGAVVSYGVVVYKSFPQIKFEAQFLQSMLVEENVQYFLMAIFFWRSTPMIAPLIPYVVFAFFNALNYTRTNLLPAIFPTPPAELSRKIQVWTETNHAAAMSFVAYVEVIGVMGSLVIGAITFQSSFLSPIVYANFLRFRFFFSIHTRAAFAQLRARLDAKIVGNPKIPPKAIKAYEVTRGAIIRFGMAAVQQPRE
ncbi:hypothetical protein BGZ80_007927 [Entomortierella chlamydospora]|uniref:Uncharacterized protein n=1 Tax=Entomortierella chlamydospora TaxID=101097 RepID=A0A9P6T1V0_9FUNG|nr:hypothetical protein BGZ79_008649 [Entomortierella chlamydospora]KAG0017780.1 hypothetical protein BGZ80_007927 [Entomortierella chlamydospora]